MMGAHRDPRPHRRVPRLRRLPPAGERARPGGPRASVRRAGAPLCLGGPGRGGPRSGAGGLAVASRGGRDRSLGWAVRRRPGEDDPPHPALWLGAWSPEPGEAGAVRLRSAPDRSHRPPAGPGVQPRSTLVAPPVPADGHERLERGPHVLPLGPDHDPGRRDRRHPGHAREPVPARLRAVRLGAPDPPGLRPARSERTRARRVPGGLRAAAAPRSSPSTPPPAGWPTSSPPGSCS